MEAVATVGLVAAIVQLVDFTTKVVVRLEDFCSKSQEAPAAFRDIRVQLPLLANDLRRTKEQIEARELSQESQKSVLAVVETCQAHVKVDQFTLSLSSTLDAFTDIFSL